MEEFVTKVIDNCISTGHNTTDKIIDKIKSEIYAIEKKMLEINSLKELKNNYKKILKLVSNEEKNLNSKSIDKNLIYGTMLIDNQLSDSILKIVKENDQLTVKEIFWQLNIDESKYNNFLKIIQKMLFEDILFRDKSDLISYVQAKSPETS